jgi:hypothetical protein
MKKSSLLPASITLLFLTTVFWPTLTLAQIPSLQGSWEVTYVISEKGNPVSVGHGVLAVCQYNEFADLDHNSAPFIYVPDPDEEDDPIYGFVWPDGRFALFKDGYNKFGGGGINFGLEILLGKLNKKGNRFKGNGTGFDSHIPNGGIWSIREIHGRRISSQPPTGACPPGNSIFPIPPPNFRIDE